MMIGLTPFADLILFVAAFIGGTINSVAGGGTFVTFPALIFAGVPAISASATSSAALFPGTAAAAWAQREDIRRFTGMNKTQMVVLSLLGGILGALLLLYTPEHTFSNLVPWLLLVATLLFAAGPWITKHTHGLNALGPVRLAVLQFAIGVYGGYFGGAIGILMLAAFQVFGMTDINAMTGFKNVLATTMNATAVVCFVIAGKVQWLPAGVMLVGAVAGGYLGASVARKMKPAQVRAIITVIGLAMVVATFVKK